jgi:hypothetical protein
MGAGASMAVTEADALKSGYTPAQITEFKTLVEPLRGYEKMAEQILEYSKANGPHQWAVVRSELAEDVDEEEFPILAALLGHADSDGAHLVHFNDWCLIFRRAVSAGVLDINGMPTLGGATFDAAEATAAAGVAVLAAGAVLGDEDLVDAGTAVVAGAVVMDGAAELVDASGEILDEAGAAAEAVAAATAGAAVDAVANEIISSA